MKFTIWKKKKIDEQSTAIKRDNSFSRDLLYEKLLFAAFETEYPDFDGDIDEKKLTSILATAVTDLQTQTSSNNLFVWSHVIDLAKIQLAKSCPAYKKFVEDLNPGSSLIDSSEKKSDIYEEKKEVGKFNQVKVIGNSKRIISSDDLPDNGGPRTSPEAIDTMALNLRGFTSPSRPRFPKEKREFKEIQYATYKIEEKGDKSGKRPKGKLNEVIINAAKIESQQKTFKVYYDSKNFTANQIVDHLSFDEPDKSLAGKPLYEQRAVFRCAASKASIVYEAIGKKKDKLEEDGCFLAKPIDVTIVNSTGINLWGIDALTYKYKTEHEIIDEEAGTANVVVTLDEEAFKKDYKRILTLQLEAFKDQGCKNLVLCGIGDGVYKGEYKNYSKVVAETYRELLENGAYKFDSVSFAAPNYSGTSTLFRDLESAFHGFSSPMSIYITTAPIDNLAIALHRNGITHLGLSNAGDHTLTPGCHWFHPGNGALKALDEKMGVVTNLPMIQDPLLNPYYFLTLWQAINCEQCWKVETDLTNTKKSKAEEKKEETSISSPAHITNVRYGNRMARIGNTIAGPNTEKAPDKKLPDSQLKIKLQAILDGIVTLNENEESKNSNLEEKENQTTPGFSKPAMAIRARKKIEILNEIYDAIKDKKNDYFMPKLSQSRCCFFSWSCFSSNRSEAERQNIKVLKDLFLEQLKIYIESTKKEERHEAFVKNCENNSLLRHNRAYFSCLDKNVTSSQDQAIRLIGGR